MLSAEKNKTDEVTPAPVAIDLAQKNLQEERESEDAAQIEHEEVVNPAEEFIPKRYIVLPVDHSDASTHTINWALGNILNSDTDLVTLLNVRPYSVPDLDMIGSPFGFVYPIEQSEKWEIESRRRAHELLIEASKTLKAAGVHVKAIAMRGDARTELQEKVDKLKPTVTIMANRGFGFVRTLFLGSVSQHLLHHSKSPILIVPFVSKG